ncbi:MAG: hypothetical protein K2K38_03000 [Clostridia bacterium]|nr:hypothetical protein [Clostridia bacterium]
MGNKKEEKKSPNKVVALVTYIVALIALLLGLFLPWGTDPALNGTTEAIWAFQLPQALKAAVPVQAFWDLIGDVGNKFTYSLPITFNGLIPSTELMPLGYDLGALFTVLYALVVLAGIVALIPAIISTCSKKSKMNIALNAASFIEVVAFLFVSIFVFIQLTAFTLGAGETYQWSWPLLGAFGGTFIMLVIQSIFYKKGSGVFKFILLLLSTLALMLTVYDLGKIIPPLDEPLAGLIGKTEGLFDGKLYYSGALGASIVGILPVLMLFCGVSEGIGLPTITKTIEGMTAIQQTLFLCTLILSLLVLINFLLDAMGLGKTTKRYMLVSNVIRYTLELVAAGLVIALPFFIEGATTGLMSLVIAVLALVALILNIIRLVRFDAKRKKIQQAVKAEMKQATAGAVADKQPEAQPEADDDKPYVYTPPVYANETNTETAEEPEVYSPVIYNGPTDEFINTLSNDQKVEFSKVFLERQNGNLTFIPDYNVGGRNDRFFNNVFIYFARLRSLVSDGLFNKMYEYGNLM